ncbi:MAG: lysophospholipid acyltransferase family protein [Alphaproteobacteria bacterium]|nr:lysophospholipid acyltransferase family protein [Alphaproteobacteria bacterium]
MKQIKRFIIDPVVATLVILFGTILWLLPLRLASSIGGWIGRKIGPRMPVTRIARENLRLAFPDRSDEAIETIISKIWDNLGRTMFELPHLRRVILERVTVIGGEAILPIISAGQNLIFVGGHLGNWEIHGPILSHQFGRVNLAYRALNNPILDWVLGRRRGGLVWRMIPKGASGMRKMITHLSEGESLGILFDQKLNNGIAVPFMGRMAMTTPAPALFAQRYGAPLVVTTVRRLPGVRFEISFKPPITVAKPQDRVAAEKQQLEIMAQLNDELGNWILDNPEQWLWLHRRWGKNTVATPATAEEKSVMIKKSA